MARTRPRSIDLAVLAAGALAVFAAGAASAADRPPLTDAPVVWYDRDDAPIPVPEVEDPGLVPYALDSFLARPFSRFWNPSRRLRQLGGDGPAASAADVNALDEVVNSTWFTNRIGLRALSDRELVEGPALGRGLAGGPDLSAPMTIVGAKGSGVTPGFTIRDARGDTWLLKFDPPTHPGMTIRAGVVANLVFHAIGFNTPVDRLVVFDRDDLVLGGNVTMRLQRDHEILMTEANLDSILAATGSIFDGRFHALGSRWLDGRPLGPFDDQGRRSDDPNDRIPHQSRRELRALRVFGAWLNHFDLKRHNSLDTYVGDPGRGHVRHYLIDFASTLGAYGDKPVPRFGFEFGLDVFPVLGRLLSFGLREDAWVGLGPPPGLAEVGLFESEVFRPEGWKPDLPQSAMADLTPRDGYWAAKIVSAFTDRQLRLLVEQGLYRDPEAVDHLVRTLGRRRDAIARHWFEMMPPLDFFRPVPQGVVFDDLAATRGLVPPGATRYRYRLGAVDAQRRAVATGPWVETDATFVPLDDQVADPVGAFQVVEVQLDRGSGWSRSVTVYRAFASGRIVALDR